MKPSATGPHFNLILRVKTSVTQNWLWALALALLAALAIAKTASLYSSSFLTKVAGFFLFLIVGSVSALLLVYVIRLHFTKRHRLEINEEGLFDYASFCELGFIPMKAIKNISFATIWGAQFLVVEFLDGKKNPVAAARGLGREIYRLLFGNELWVPLNFFRMSRIDLESQLIHLDRILQEKSGPDEPPRPHGSGLAAPVLTGVAIANKSDRGSSFAQRASTAESVPPPLSQVRTDKQRVLEKIREIKDSVSASGFDGQVAHLYFDHIAMFPALAASSPDHLPSGVTHISSIQQGADYEEVGFIYRGETFIFGLRRDIGNSDEALLSLGVGGRVHLSIKVRVEIGELTPLELESFVAGPWQTTIQGLMAEILRQESVRQGPFKDASEKAKDISTQTATNLEDLKNRFGIEE
jgi:hypothetical protein